MEPSSGASEIITSAVGWLTDAGEVAAAGALRACSASISLADVGFMLDGEAFDIVEIRLACKPAIHEVLANRSHPTTSAIERAFKAVIRSPSAVVDLVVEVEGSGLKLHGS
ncbi:MAG: hypothetical protein HY331_09645 [Chloroflexi bacterium]|nr:hypothetical protein [Chloroflexota bacterium]